MKSKQTRSVEVTAELRAFTGHAILHHCSEIHLSDHSNLIQINTQKLKFIFKASDNFC